eukprot:scaffold1705_cov304-Prasinococcus_capsulatus_cf.AAC.10
MAPPLPPGTHERRASCTLREVHELCTSRTGRRAREQLVGGRLALRWVAAIAALGLRLLQLEAVVARLVALALRHDGLQHLAPAGGGVGLAAAQVDELEQDLHHVVDCEHGARRHLDVLADGQPARRRHPRSAAVVAAVVAAVALTVRCARGARRRRSRRGP